MKTLSDESEVEVDSWDALSGSRKLLPIPNATDWQLSNLNYRDERGDRYNERMMRDGHGFSIDITPDPRWGRGLLRIHPDGGATGTQGCIGLTCNYNGLIRFENTVRDILDANNNRVRLEVHGSYHGPDKGWPKPVPVPVP